MKPGPRARSFASNIHFGPECWEWIGYKNKYGYGRFKEDCKPLAAHRVAYEIAHGPIPEGMHVLHKCDNPACVRRDHLFLGTAADNQLDKCKKGRHHNQAKTHCPHGHEYTADNVYMHQGMRHCKSCTISRSKIK